MSDENNGRNAEERQFWLKRAPITIIGVLLLGIVGSTLYDLLVKPGLTSVGRFVLEIITLGSTSLRDSAYSSAALDPTPLSALFLLLGVFAITIIPAVDVFYRTRKRKEISDFENKLNQAQEGEAKEILEAELTRLNRGLRRTVLLFWIVFIPYWMGMFIGFSLHNQSIIIWRAFHANVTILSPQITNDEKAQLMAHFASMSTAEDYKKIQSEMRELATKHNIKLRQINTW